MSKNILIIKGSPRERGNSAVLANQVAAGAQAAGGEVESVYLHGLDIRACDGCDLCAPAGASCAIEDGMQPLYPKIAAADAIVLASPVYWFTFSAQMKLFIDRCYAFQSSRWQGLGHKKFGLVLTYGDTDLYTSGAINAIHTFETLCRFLRSEIVDMVYGTMLNVGEAEKRTELMEQAYKLGQKLAV